jgi:hypothetical protein
MRLAKYKKSWRDHRWVNGSISMVAADNVGFYRPFKQHFLFGLFSLRPRPSAKTV